MSENIRSELFFLKQFGFTSALLQYIFFLGIDPIQVIFTSAHLMHWELEEKFTAKEKRLSKQFSEYENFKLNLFKNEEILKKKKINKIYFKYDNNSVTKLIPENIMPLFMYSKGNAALLKEDQKRVAIVGTRQPSKKTIQVTQKITREFVKKDFIIVSGLAEGTDTISHKTAIENDGKTIAVLPTNFKNIYPKENKILANRVLDKGLLLTSVGPKENTYRFNFLERNKYVANISDLVIVTETNLNSGTMNTLRNASKACKKILFIDQKDIAINKEIYKFGGKMLYV